MAAIQQFETSWLGWDTTNGRLVFWDGKAWRYFEDAAGLVTAESLDADLALKAPLASPTFTGIPAAPTASLGANTTQLATTAFVQAAIAALINAAPGALDTLDELAAALGDDANFAASVTTALAGKLALTGGNLSGTLGVGGATADATNKLAVNSAAILFNHAGDDIQVKLNKAAAGDDAAFLFQTGFSTRALIGLLGDDDFTFKVTPDGAAFYTAFVLDADNGNVGFAAPFGVQGGPQTPAIASDAITVTKSYAVPAPETGSADNLATINGGFDGALLVLSGTASKTITVKDGTGNLKLASDCVLDNFEDTITLIKRGTEWLEIARSNNG
jgi:hypothetical protein